MATISGVVAYLSLSRKECWIQVNPIGSLGSAFLTVYSDDDAALIDPTELVRRNWLIALLKDACATRRPVAITVDDTLVREVRIAAPAAIPATATVDFLAKTGTRGRVTLLAIEASYGKVVIRNALLMPSTMGTQPTPTPVDHTFAVYDDTVESARPDDAVRRDWLDLLKQALVHRLDVTVWHRDTEDAFIRMLELHGPEN